MTERDVNALQGLLDALYPESERLKILAAAGYWNDLAEIASHISDADRIRVLSMLWGEHEEITALMRLCVDALAQLGYAAEAFCPRDALLDRDAHTGWFMHHPRSIIAAATIFDLGGAEDSGVRVVGRYGHAAMLPRSSIAAVVLELGVFSSSSPNAVLRHADVVDLPSLQLPPDMLPLVCNSGAHIGRKSELLARIFASAKAQHLVDRACHRAELTSLLACCVTDADAADLLAPSIGDWIDLVQGEEPHVREHSRTGLFVVAASHTGAIGTASRAAKNGPAGHDVCGALAGEDDWSSEWTPGRPFSNVYTWRLEPHVGSVPPMSRIGRRGASTHNALLRLPTSGESGGRDVTASEYAFCVDPDHIDAQRLMQDVVLVSQAGRKHRQLRRRLAELNRNMRARFLRYRADNDLVEAGDWRQRIAATIEHRLARTARRGKLGRLIAALTISEAELVAVFRRADRSGLNQRLRQAAIAVIDLEADYGVMAPASEKIVPRGRSITMAEAAVSCWLSAIRRCARSPRFCRQVGIADFLLEHIADEVSVGAVRLGVVRRVAEVIEVSVVRERGGEKTFAATVGAVVNGFVERLALDVAQADAASSTPSGSGQIAALHAADLDAVGEPRDLATAWCEAFSALVEANIASARFWSAGEASTDLARILAQFPANNLEVE